MGKERKELINQEINQLIRKKDNNELVIFVGSGVSRNSQLPDWLDLIKAFANELEIPTDNLSIDDYLDIPQQYLDVFQESNYYRKINEIFSIKADPNPIHELIFNLNPKHIITTNFDDLLEKQNDMLNKYYSPICEGNDIPIAINKENKIIKMHGDIKLKNIVLTKKDYDGYENNFPAISNEIKYCFSNYHFLIIGFSCNDPNFKIINQQLMKWYDKFKLPIYLLNTANTISEEEVNNFNDNRITLLEYDYIKDKIEKNEDIIKDLNVLKIKDEVGKKLYKFLKYFLLQTEKTTNHNFSTVTNFLEDTYKKILPFKNVKALLPEQLYSILDPSTSRFYIRYNELILKDNNLCNSIIEKKLRKDFFGVNKDKTKELIYFLRKSGIVAISNNQHKIFINIEKHTDSKYSNENKLFNDFNYVELDELADIACKNKDKHCINDLFKYSIILFNLGRPFEAFELLQIVRDKSKNNNNFYYFISEYNRHRVSDHLWRNSLSRFRPEPTLLDKVREETTNFDLDFIFCEDNTKENCLYNIKYINFANSIKTYDLLLSAIHDFEIDIIDEFYKDIKMINSGGYTEHNPPLLIRANFYFQQIQRFINDNFLIYDHHGIYTKYIKLYCKSVFLHNKIEALKKKDENKIITIFKARIEPYPLRFEFLSLLIRHFDKDNLEKLFEELEIDYLDLMQVEKNKLISAYVNLLKFGKKVNRGFGRLVFFDFFEDNFISIFKRIKLTKKEKTRIKSLSKKYLNILIRDTYFNF